MYAYVSAHHGQDGSNVYSLKGWLSAMCLTQSGTSLLMCGWVTIGGHILHLTSVTCVFIPFTSTLMLKHMELGKKKPLPLSPL